MSIAVSVVAHPSRILFSLLLAMTALAASIALAVFAGWIGELNAAGRAIAGTPCIFVAFFGFYHGLCHRKTLHIDISGAGQIRVTEMLLDRPCRNAMRPHLRKEGELVELLEDSTIWPMMMVLRLRASDGRMMVVPILQDSVPGEAFRALQVACRWIAARGGERQKSICEKRSR